MPPGQMPHNGMPPGWPVAVVPPPPPHWQQTRPPTQARLDFRHKMAMKRANRLAEARPAAVAWRFARELVDVLWHQQATAQGKLIVAGGVAVVVALPVLMLYLLVNAVFGGSN
jgi:hypothetical protein